MRVASASSRLTSQTITMPSPRFTDLTLRGERSVEEARRGRAHEDRDPGAERPPGLGDALDVLGRGRLRQPVQACDERREPALVGRQDVREARGPDDDEPGVERADAGDLL